jgi:hypothetical protein
MVCPDELPDMRFGITHFNFDEYMQNTVKELGYSEVRNTDQGKGKGKGKGKATGTGKRTRIGKGKKTGSGSGLGKGRELEVSSEDERHSAVSTEEEGKEVSKKGRAKKEGSSKRKRPIMEDSEEGGEEEGKKSKAKKGGKAGMSAKRFRPMLDDSEDEGNSAVSAEHVSKKKERKKGNQSDPGLVIRSKVSARGGGLASDKPTDKDEEKEFQATTSTEVLHTGHDDAAPWCGLDEGIAGVITQALGNYLDQQHASSAELSPGSAYVEASGDIDRVQVSDALSSPGIGHVSLGQSWYWCFWTTILTPTRPRASVHLELVRP